MTSIALTIATGPMAALSIGSGDRPVWPPVRPVHRALFVPGYTGSKEDFSRLWAAAWSGYRAIAIDQRGSTNRPGPRQTGAIAFEPWPATSSISPGVRESGDRLHLVGHSPWSPRRPRGRAGRTGAVRLLHVDGLRPGAITGYGAEVLEAVDECCAAGGLAALWDQIALSSQADSKFRQSPPALLPFSGGWFLRANDPVGLQAMGGRPPYRPGSD